MRSQRSRLGRRTAAVALTALGWLGVGVASAVPASAHAELFASTPANLQILDAPPKSVVLIFNEEVTPGLSSVRVMQPGHAPLRTGRPSHAEQGSHALVVPITSPVTAGDYAIVWRAVTPDDGHTTTGSLSFRTLHGSGTTDESADAVLPDDTAPPVVDVDTGSRPVGAAVYGVARWLAFLGFAGLVGAAYLRGSSRRNSHAAAALRRMTVWSWALLTGASALALTSYGAYAEGGGWRDLVDPTLLGVTLGTRTGVALTARIFLLGLIAALAVRLERSGRIESSPSSRQEQIVLGSAALLAVTWSVVSHSASGSRPGPFMLIDITHLVATALWVGGLVAVIVASSPRSDPSEATQLLRRFSTAATASVVVLVATGVVQTWQRVGSFGALTDNDYAALLLVKVGLVGVTLLVAAVTRHLVLRRRASVPTRPRATLPRSPLRGLVTIEATFGVVVLAVTAMLVTTEPAGSAHAAVVAAREKAAARPPAAAVAPAALPNRPGLAGSVPYDASIGSKGTGTVQVSVLSTHPGATEIHLSVLDARGVPRALARLAVALRQSGGAGQSLPVRFRVLGPGHYVSVGATLPEAGHWQLGIALGLPGGAADVAVAALDVR